MQRIVLRTNYGIHADTKLLISHDSAFSLASILLTLDFIKRVACLDEFSSCFE